MANSIAKVTQYLKDTVALNAVYKQASLTTDLEAPKVQFLGADTVKLPKITFGAGLGTYSRATGHVANDITLAWDTYALTQDKGNALKLDAMDDEEGLNTSIIPYVNEYIRTVVTPAVDTYRFGELVSKAGKIKASETITASNAFEAILAAIEYFDENEVPSEGNILYINPAINTLLQTDTLLSKKVEIGTWGGNADLQVRMINGNKIVVVPASRLGTNMNFLLVNPASVMGVVKHNPASFFAQGMIPGFDGSEVDYRLYHDLFVLDSKDDGVYLSKSVA